MSAHQHTEASPSGTAEDLDSHRSLLYRLLIFNRGGPYTAQAEDPERASTPEEDARKITSHILTLLNERARLLGQPNLSLSTQWEVMGFLHGHRLSRQEECLGLMNAEILITRRKVLDAIARYGMEQDMPTGAALRIELANSGSKVSDLEKTCRGLKKVAYVLMAMCCMLAVGIVITVFELGGRCPSSS
ncbi:MAG: hypothetical protein Q9207_003382 [Kuettlingeria erythrocarpa]